MKAHECGRSRGECRGGCRARAAYRCSWTRSATTPATWECNFTFTALCIHTTCCDRPTSLFHKFLTARDSRVSLSAENSPSSNVGWSVDWLPLSLSLSSSSSISPVAFLCVPSASLGFPLRFAVTVLTLTLLLLLRFDMVLWGVLCSPSFLRLLLFCLSLFQFNFDRFSCWAEAGSAALYLCYWLSSCLAAAVGVGRTGSETDDRIRTVVCNMGIENNDEGTGCIL